MCLIHNRGNLMVLALASIAALAGCQGNVPQGMSPVNTTPLVIDEAMQKRDWDRSTSVYASGATVAGGTGFVWQTHETIPDDWRRLTDAPISVANMVCLPAGVFLNSPFGSQVYRGEAVPPSYTAQPPLPPLAADEKSAK